ncbi:CMD domain protein [Variovorax sp. YR216]|uniref:CMD domain protein n=1 Tax=Variovorax sp. YR216 TaxID=1882828 RepID=UPI00089B3D31|nr:CMD domain protein [Variovorax sp. YR216]SEB13986.1 CMD domain protein, Avi_7170 family [Variovorax sp. YR216]
MTSSTASDVIDQLAGIPPGNAIDAIRARRAQARLHGQNSYLALFEPPLPLVGEFTLPERFAVATFVAALHRQAQATAFYADGLARDGSDRGLVDALVTEAAAVDSSGPYGRYPAGRLTLEDVPGPAWRVSDALACLLGPRLSAALVHAHLLVFHPRDAQAQDLQALLDAGWSTTDIVTLSQLVAFLAYQVRVAAGLQVLRDTPVATQAEASASEAVQS